MKRSRESIFGKEYRVCKKQRVDEVEQRLSQMKECTERCRKWQIFCSHSLENDLLSLSNEEKKKCKPLIGDIILCVADNDIMNINSEPRVIVKGVRKAIYKIKNTLKRMGFKWNANGNYEWTMNRAHFIADFDLYIADMLQMVCDTNRLKLSVFDFEFAHVREQRLLKAINLFIWSEPSANGIYLKTSTDEEAMLALIHKHKYELCGYGESEMNIYFKKGMLYDGHIETWKEYTVFHGWVLGFISENIALTPHCIDCGAQLTLHKVKKCGRNEGRRFYNCDRCYYHSQKTEKRKYSFIWADGDLGKISELCLNQHLTQPFSQIVI